MEELGGTQVTLFLSSTKTEPFANIIKIAMTMINESTASFLSILEWLEVAIILVIVLLIRHILKSKLLSQISLSLST